MDANAAESNINNNVNSNDNNVNESNNNIVNVNANGIVPNVGLIQTISDEDNLHEQNAEANLNLNQINNLIVNNADEDVEVNNTNNAITITDNTHPLLVSEETLTKINLDKEFLSALPKDLIIETIVNQLSM